MPALSDYANLCDICVYAPCLCGNDPENCASYIQKHGFSFTNRNDSADDGFCSYGERKDL